MNISPELLPSYKTSSAYFILASVFYFIFTLTLLISQISWLDVSIHPRVSIHLFTLGFVMLVIFTSLTQLLAVIFEVKYTFYKSSQLLLATHSLGLLLLVYAFMYDDSFLGISLFLLMISMAIFIVTQLLSIKSSNVTTMLKTPILISLGFLFIGLLFAVLMVFNFLNIIQTPFQMTLEGHILSLFFGFVFILLISLSMILIPRFALPRDYTKQPFKLSYISMSLGLLSFYVSAMASSQPLRYISFILIIVSLLAYAYQLFHFNKKRITNKQNSYTLYLFYLTKKSMQSKENIYTLHLHSAFIFLLLAIGFGIISFFIKSDTHIYIAGWFFLVGFLGTMILGHLYKIVPFLIWQYRFLDLVDEQTVPLFHEMYSQKLALFQWILSSLGVFLYALSLYDAEKSILGLIASLCLTVSASFFIINIVKMYLKKA